MRLSITILIVCLNLCASGYSQERISLSEKNATLLTVFQDIQKQTSFSLWYEKSQLPTNPLVTIELKDATLDEVLMQCCKDFNLEYSMAGNMVVIKLKAKNSDKTQVKYSIQGQVLNEKKEPLEGAAIIVKGTKFGTSTDATGNFHLHSEKRISEIEVSFTGYQTKIIQIESLQSITQSITVQLSISTNPLDQIQIIAYGTTSKRLNTGDVSSITAESIAAQPVTNLLATMEGRVPGLYIQEYNGVPGTAFNVQLRGQNSITAGNNPLYVIDGVPFPSQPIGSSFLNGSIIGGGNPLNGINTSDIERVDILKDGEATAIYGSRGANGVILITTKKGSAGKTNIDLSAYTGFGKITRGMDLLSTPNYLAMRNQAFKNDQATPQPYDYDLTQWDTTSYTDWQKQLLGGSASLTSVSGTVSGGGKNTQVLITGSYQNETTVFPGEFKDERGSVFVNMSHASDNQKFKINFSASYLIENSILPSGDPTNNAIMLAPDAPPPYDSTGKLNWQPGFSNPYSMLLSTYNSRTNNLISNAVLSYQILKNLQLKASFGYTQVSLNETRLRPSSAINPAFSSYDLPTSYFNSASLNTWILEPQLVWHKTVGVNQWEVLIGTTFQQTTNNGQTYKATGFTSDAMMENVMAASSVTPQQYLNTLYRYEGFFARLIFNRQDKYLLNLVARRDGSSRFGPGNQFANFGAIGAGWIFSNEDFMKDHSSILSFGKIRASYGVTGNDQIGDYQYLSNWGSTNYPYNGLSGIYPLNLANQNYSWEVNKKFETGLELGFFHDALLISSSYFFNRSSSQLVGYSLPSFTGFTSVQANLPAIVQNTGWEFQVTSTNINKKQFTWKTTFNLTIPTNKLVSYPGIDASPYANTYEIGKSLYTVKAFAYAGVDPTEGVYLFQSNTTGKPTAFPVYPDDLQANKQVSKEYFGGLLNSFQLKNWYLEIFIQFVNQTGRSYLYTYGAPGFLGNQPSYVLSRWQQPGDITNVQKFTQDYASVAYGAYANASYFGDNTIVNASFVRVKNINLSYQFTGKAISSMKIQAAKVFLRLQNLFTITNYQGMDPEAQNVGNLPPLKMFVGGFQITL